MSRSLYEFEIPSSFSDCSDDEIRSCLVEARSEFDAINESDDLSDTALDRLTDLADMIENGYNELENRAEALADKKLSFAKRIKQAVFANKYVSLQTEDDEEPMKSEDGVKFPKEAYAYTPSDNVSEWKLRLWATPDGGPDSRIVGAAVAALGKGFRGNKVEIPTEDLDAVKAKVKAAWIEANPDKDEEDIPAVIAAVTTVVAAGFIRVDKEGYVPKPQLPPEHVEAMSNVAENLIALAETIFGEHYMLEDADPDSVTACGELRHGDDVDEFEMRDFDMMFEPIEGADREFLEGLLPHHDAILQMIADTEFKNLHVAKFAGMLAKKLVKTSAKIRRKLDFEPVFPDEEVIPAPAQVEEFPEEEG